MMRPIARALRAGARVAAIALATGGSFATASADENLSPGFEVDAAQSSLTRATRHADKPYRGPIVDMLAHVTPTYDIGDIVDQLHAATIDFAVFMPVPNEGIMGARNGEGTERKIALANRAPDSIKVFCGGDYLSNWLDEAQHGFYLKSSFDERLKHLDKDLANGVCAGLGEFGLLHFNKLGHQNIIRLKPDAATTLAVVELVAKRGAWLQLHAEPKEPDGTPHFDVAFGALALWFDRYPDLKVIISHTAMTNPGNVRRLLQMYPKVYMTIKMVRNNSGNWTHLEPVAFEGEFYEDWAALFEEMPDRFMVGTDVKFGQDNNPDNERNYRRTVFLLRNALGGLKPAAAEAIARGNAKRLFAIEPQRR